MHIRHNCDISDRFSSRLRATAAATVELESAADLDNYASGDLPQPHCFLGRGSNVIPDSDHFPGTLLTLGGDFKQIEGNWTTGELVVGAAVPLPVLAYQACRHGWAGMEELGGIPGSAGGSLVMNAGVGERGTVAFGPLVTAAEIHHPGHGCKWEPIDHQLLTYRHSPYQERLQLICRLRLQFHTQADPATLLQAYANGRTWRKRHQPLDLPNWGSTFVNPPGDYAGRLIEACGLKGTREGDLEVSPLQANFIVNHGSGTGPQAVTLITRIRDAVQQTAGVTLKREVRYLSEFPTKTGC